MNQLENCQARYGSNTWMVRTRTDGPGEFEPSKFDCNLDRKKHVYSYTTPGYESKMKYDVKTERVRGERGYEEERYTTVETSARYVYNAKM